MNKGDKEILMESIINCDDTKCLENLDRFELVLDNSFFDYELLKAALDKKRGTIADFLINKGCRVRNPNKIYLEETPLHLAMKLHDSSIISLILSKDASVYDKNLKGETPLYAAFKEKYYSAVTAVLDYISTSNLSFNPDNKDDVLHFHIACITKHVNSVKLYLTFGFDVNSYLSIDEAEFSGLTPLHYLVREKDYGDLFEILLEHSDLSIKNSNGLTPLHSIYYNCDAEYDEEYLFHAPDYYKVMTQVFNCGNNTKFINAVDNSCVSHFHLCCSIDRPDLVQVFINSGVDVNSSTSLNCKLNADFTPLHFAAKYNCLEVVELLLKNGADCNKSSKKGATPLHLVCAHFESDKEIKIINMLLDFSACPIAVDKLGNTPIHLTFERTLHHISEQVDILDKLMSKVPLKVNLIDQNGLSLFHIVCTRNNPDQVNDFLNSGVVIDSCVVSGKFEGYTALHFAVLFNQKDIVEVLLKRNAQVNIKTSKLDTPLHLACEFTELKFYEVHCEYEKIRSSDKPINLDWITNRKSQLDIINLLLLHGADIEPKNSYNYTPLFAAYRVQIEDISYYPEFFRNNLIDEINTTLLEITNILLSNKANIIGFTNDQQWSIFHVISRGKLPWISDELIECLITAGADINAIDKDGLTPLHSAAEFSKDKLVEIYLKHKADVNAKCKKSKTPLEMAIEKYNLYENSVHDEEDDILLESSEFCITTLLENGSDVNVRTQDGSTLLHDAVSCSSTFLVENLLNYGADINMEDSSGNSTACSLLTDGEVNNRIHVAFFIFIHVQKLLALGLYVNDKVQKFCSTYLQEYIEAVLSDDNFRRIWNNLLDARINELNMMKVKKIDSYTSLYNVLLKDPHELSKYVRNKSLIEILEGDDIDDQFPVYSFLLKLQYRKGLLRRDVLKSAKASLNYVTCSNLPDLCYDSILRYLTNEEIVNLKAVKATKDSCNKRKLNDNVLNETETSIKLQKNE